MSFGESLNSDVMSDETFDLLCVVCKRKGTNREAEKYCVECNDSYCLLCVKIHEDVPLLNEHNFLDQEQFKSRSIRRKQTYGQGQHVSPTEKCDSHNHYYIDMYCQNHDDVGCVTCMAVGHRSCHDVFYIPEFLQNNTNISTPKQVQKKLDSATRILMEHHATLQHQKQKLLKGKSESLENVMKFRKEINDKLDELEKDSIDEIEIIYKSLINEIDAALGLLQENKVNVTSARGKVASTCNNVSQAFVDVKKGEQLAETAAKYVEDSKEHISSVDVDHTAHQRLSFYLEKMNAIGIISQRDIKAAERTATTTALQQSIPSYNSRKKEIPVSGNAQQKDVLHCVTGKKKESIKVEPDKSDIIRPLALEDMTIILSDNNDNN